MFYPITIIKDRYSGIYRKGAWIAFFKNCNELPNEAFSDDSEAANNFWLENREVVGIGNSPDDAYCDLYIKMREKYKRKE